MSANRPTLEEIESYCSEIESLVKPEKFYEYYERSNWCVGGNPISDWKALFRSWDKNEKKQPSKADKFRITGRKMATLDNPEFASYVEWFTRCGADQMLSRVRKENA